MIQTIIAGLGDEQDFFGRLRYNHANLKILKS
jgi:hypothetical protein